LVSCLLPLVATVIFDSSAEVLDDFRLVVSEAIPSWGPFGINHDHTVWTKRSNSISRETSRPEMDKKLHDTITWSGTVKTGSQPLPQLTVAPGRVFGNGVLFRPESAEVSGRCLHYLIGGDGEHPVLLVHGFSSSWLDWKILLEPLVRAGFTPIVLDYRGVGETVSWESGDDKKCMTCDLHQLITFLNINQVDIVGHTSAGNPRGNPGTLDETK